MSCGRREARRGREAGGTLRRLEEANGFMQQFIMMEFIILFAGGGSHAGGRQAASAAVGDWGVRGWSSPLPVLIGQLVMRAMRASNRCLDAACAEGAPMPPEGGGLGVSRAGRAAKDSSEARGKSASVRSRRAPHSLRPPRPPPAFCLLPLIFLRVLTQSLSLLLLSLSLPPSSPPLLSTPLFLSSPPFLPAFAPSASPSPAAILRPCTHNCRRQRKLSSPSLRQSRRGCTAYIAGRACVCPLCPPPCAGAVAANRLHGLCRHKAHLVPDRKFSWTAAYMRRLRAHNGPSGADARRQSKT